jgi:tetrapyrrole methylase family protein/MazG family protein
MKIHSLIRLAETLRTKCPWDRKQTLTSLKNKVIEEAHEVAAAIEDGDVHKIEEEIGDMLFLSLFLAIVFEEERGIRADSLITRTVKKYKVKHPHVFKTAHLPDAESVLQYWHKSKKDAFDGIPQTMPALLATHIIQERAAKLGFDWDSHQGPLKKVNEEIGELQKSTTSEKSHEEFGDLLFACVNLARHLHIDPEESLKCANKKFIKRFKKIEEELKKRGKPIEEASLKEMDAIWDEIKGT